MAIGEGLRITFLADIAVCSVVKAELFYEFMRSNNSSVYWHDGNLIQGQNLEIPIDDPGLLYGATVFTTMRVYDGNLDCARTNWRGQCDRLLTSLQSLHWQLPDWTRVRQGAAALSQHFPVLRITIFPDGRELIIGRHLPADLTEKQKYGISAWVAVGGEFERSLPTHKTGNYLSAWLALNRAKQYGAAEAILIDAAGNWLETSTGNLWGWRDGMWWTPPLRAGILPGLMRQQLMSWLVSQNEKVGEAGWTPDWVEGLEAIAYSNSVVEIVPIHTIITTTGAHQSKIQNPKSKILTSPSHEAFENLRGFYAEKSPNSEIS
jgi:4-amino-4-deoxychorismate lyase